MLEIDLHQMNFDTALKIFIEKYNQALRKGYRGEICVIHGYGAGHLDKTPVIRTKLREYLGRNRIFLSVRLDMNPGVTYVTPKVSLPLPFVNSGQKRKTKKRTDW